MNSGLNLVSTAVTSTKSQQYQFSKLPIQHHNRQATEEEATGEEAGHKDLQDQQSDDWSDCKQEKENAGQAQVEAEEHHEKQEELVLQDFEDEW